MCGLLPEVVMVDPITLQRGIEEGASRLLVCHRDEASAEIKAGGDHRHEECDTPLGEVGRTHSCHLPRRSLLGVQPVFVAEEGVVFA